MSSNHQENIELECGDAYQLIKKIPDNSIDLIITDPPYLIKKTNAGDKSELARSIQKMNDEIRNAGIVGGIDNSILGEFIRVMKKPNIYIWCNGAQIPGYIDYFVNRQKCKMDIIIWHKPNATPLFNNKYLTDKEYCLYFRGGGYCSPQSYEAASTVYHLPINIKDKKMYNHPTIKPLLIIKNLVMNSSRRGETVLDPFMGSGTTGVRCAQTGRSFIGIELNAEYFQIREKRILNTSSGVGEYEMYGQMYLFDEAE